jgi:hypothetical protein
VQGGFFLRKEPFERQWFFPREQLEKRSIAGSARWFCALVLHAGSAARIFLGFS